MQVAGSKTVWLASPEMTEYMYPYPAGETTNPATNTTNPTMSNTSRVDVFLEDIDEKEHPNFWRHVVPKAICATLEEGDLLFFPPGWWHAMRGESASFSVSMWF